jgi:hypothetical protein
VTVQQSNPKINKQEFMKIFEVYELWKYEQQFSLFFQESDYVPSEGGEIQNVRSIKQESKGVFSRGIGVMIKSIRYELVLNIISIIQLLELAFNDKIY